MNVYRSKLLLLFVFFCTLFCKQTKAQCTEIISSTNGYDVTVGLNLTGPVITATSCPWGYHYEVSLDYSIAFSGSSVPSSMYTLQANLTCGTDNLFVSLPNSDGTGSLTTSANQYANTSDCATATLTSLGCGPLTLQISGPGISNQYISMDCSPSTLPVELSYFKAEPQKGKVLLSWETVSESFNDHFIVERSVDFVNWSVVSQVDGHGNSTTTKEYNTFDYSPVYGVSYYRLKQVDYNGEVHDYKALAVKYFPDEIEVVRTDQDNLTLLADGIHTLECYDLQGRNHSAELTLNRYSNGIQIDIDQLIQGVYILKTNVGTVKIVK